MKVRITRSSGDFLVDEIELDDIYSIHWDNVSGGVRKRQAGFSLYGYISYELASKLNIKCSGQHNKGRNEAKVKILKATKGDEYYEGYKNALAMAGEKPTPLNSWKGKTPCTKRMLQILSEGKMHRKDLRRRLLKEGYTSGTILNNIRKFSKEGKIECDGSSYSPYQIIRIAENDAS